MINDRMFSVSVANLGDCVVQEGSVLSNNLTTIYFEDHTKMLDYLKHQCLLHINKKHEYTKNENKEI